uniref:CopG family antitoxin n=1 Tax=Okeania sp. SIO2F4 TaxID=2607790 RepID=UPI003446E677
MENKSMKPEYDLTKMKSRPNPYAKKLKQQVNLSLGIEVIEYFEKKAEEKGISYQQLINLYLQDCVNSKRELSF